MTPIDPSLPIVCYHCGEKMVWVEDLYLVHITTQLTYCLQANVDDER